jgi:hypothetical protein
MYHWQFQRREAVAGVDDGNHAGFWLVLVMFVSRGLESKLKPGRLSSSVLHYKA